MEKLCKICNGLKTVYGPDPNGDELICPCCKNGHVEIIGQDRKVHHRVPCWHKRVEEAIAAEGYTFRSWENYPDI